MQGICTYIPETNYVPREYSVAAVRLLLYMVLIFYLFIIIIIIVINASKKLALSGSLCGSGTKLGTTQPYVENDRLFKSANENVFKNRKQEYKDRSFLRSLSPSLTMYCVVMRDMTDS